MRLTHWTDYSLRVLMFCAQSESRQTAATIQEIAEQHDISKSHLTKIVMTLAADGYLITSRGRGGGLRLGRPASEIVIGEVIRKTESDFSIVECFQDGVSHCALMPSCRLKNVLADALKVFFEKLDGVTLADLIVDAQDQQAVIRTVRFSLDKKKGASVKAG